jgi:hypothetical protein
MMAIRSRCVGVFAILTAVGCTQPDAAMDEPDAAVQMPDAAEAAVDCVDEEIELHGPVSLATRSAATVTSGGKIAGVNGSAGANRLYVLNVRPTAGKDLDAVGTYDVAMVPLQYLDQPLGGCSGAAACIGFFALAGTIEVTAVQPRFRATFTLRDLRERADSNSSPGAAIPGEITGCVSAVPI